MEREKKNFNAKNPLQHFVKTKKNCILKLNFVKSKPFLEKETLKSCNVFLKIKGMGTKKKSPNVIKKNINYL